MDEYRFMKLLDSIYCRLDMLYDGCSEHQLRVLVGNLQYEVDRLNDKLGLFKE